MVAGCFIYFLCQVSCHVNFMPLITPLSCLVEAVFNKVWALSGICPSSTKKWRNFINILHKGRDFQVKVKKDPTNATLFVTLTKIHEYNERPKNDKLTSLTSFFTFNLICKNQPHPRKNSQSVAEGMTDEVSIISHGWTEVKGGVGVGVCVCDL